VTVSAGAAVQADADAELRAALARVVQANERWERLAAQLREENVALRAENERLRAENERISAELAVLQRLVFGRSSERTRPQPAADDEDQSGPGDTPGERQSGDRPRRGPGGRAGRRDYSHLPRVEVIWDFTEGGYCCPQCSSPFESFGEYAAEQVDWRVTVRVVVHRRRRYRRRCRCEGPRTVTAPGPPKAIGKGLFSNGFIAMLLVERYVAGRSQNSLVAGLTRHGAQISPATLVGTCTAAGALLAPLEEQIVARSRDSWHLHADETSWHVFTPDTGDGPARWWLWVFIGADTTCFVMDPTRAGTVPARHAGIDTDTDQLTPDDDGGPRRLVISSDFSTVYASAGKRTDGLTNLYCWAHIRRYFVRAGDANPTQLQYWTRDWLDRIKTLYLAHDELSDAWNASVAPRSGRAAAEAAARLDDAYTAWDTALQEIDTTRQAQMPATAGEEGPGHPRPRVGRPGRTPRLPHDQPGQQRRGKGAAPARGDPQERLRLPHRRRRPPRRHRLDRHRDRRTSRPQRLDLPHRLPRRLRPQRRQTLDRPGPSTIPALERLASRPAHLGPTTPAQLTHTVTTTAPPQPATPTVGMPTIRVTHSHPPDLGLLTTVPDG